MDGADTDDVDWSANMTSTPARCNPKRRVVPGAKQNASPNGKLSVSLYGIVDRLDDVLTDGVSYVDDDTDSSSPKSASSAHSHRGAMEPMDPDEEEY